MDLCQYSNIFGEVGKGVHSIRIFNIAIVDTLSTIILAYIISAMLKIKFWKVLIILFILGIFLHRLFCVQTTIDRIIFG